MSHEEMVTAVLDEIDAVIGVMQSARLLVNTDFLSSAAQTQAVSFVNSAIRDLGPIRDAIAGLDAL